MATDISAVRETLRHHCHPLLRRANVVATGAGFKVSGGAITDTPAIICSVERKLPAGQLSASDRVPELVEGVPTDVIETGPIRALAARTDRHRPAPGGVSIGHRQITAGTLGCLVRRGSEVLILSNNHVMANSNAAAPGDAILQPGPHDGGRFPDDHLAELVDFVPISFGSGGFEPPSGCGIATAVADILNDIAAVLGSNARLRAVSTDPASAQAGDNLVDAAIARPLEPGLVSAEIIDIGQLDGLAEGALGMAIQKSGRTTSHTTDTISQIDVTVNVQYGPGQVATFTDQLLAGPMSQGGDSGSAVLDMDRRLVGLLFAGSDSSTIINRIQHVFGALNLTL